MKEVTHRTVDHSKLSLPPLLIKMRRETEIWLKKRTRVNIKKAKVLVTKAKMKNQE